MYKLLLSSKNVNLGLNIHVMLLKKIGVTNLEEFNENTVPCGTVHLYIAKKSP